MQRDNIAVWLGVIHHLPIARLAVHVTRIFSARSNHLSERYRGTFSRCGCCVTRVKVGRKVRPHRPRRVIPAVFPELQRRSKTCLIWRAPLIPIQHSPSPLTFLCALPPWPPTSSLVELSSTARSRSTPLPSSRPHCQDDTAHSASSRYPFSRNSLSTLEAPVYSNTHLKSL